MSIGRSREMDCFRDRRTEDDFDEARKGRDGRGQSCPQNVGSMTDAEKPEIPTVFCIFQPRKLLENNVTNIRYLQNVPSKPDALSHRVIRPKVQGKLDQHKLRSARQGKANQP